MNSALDCCGFSHIVFILIKFYYKFCSEPSINIFWLIYSGRSLSKIVTNLVWHHDIHLPSLLRCFDYFRYWQIWLSCWPLNEFLLSSCIIHPPYQTFASVQICVSQNPVYGWLCRYTFPNAVSVWLSMFAVLQILPSAEKCYLDSVSCKRALLHRPHP